MINDDAYVPASRLLNIVLPVHHQKRIFQIHHGKIKFYSNMPHDLLIG
jgi:hypothetical protein